MQQAFACSAPHAGPELNALITVQEISDNKYIITAPKKAMHLEFEVNILLAYYPEDQKYRSPKHSQELEKVESGGNYIATAIVKPKKGYIPFFMVIWEPEFCCLCSAVAFSKDIKLK